MTEFPVHGGCHCGAVRYTLSAPAISVHHCHCSRCRKLFGQQSGTGALIARSAIRIEDESNLVDYRSSPGFRFRFCRTCGCHLFGYMDDNDETMYFSPGTLDGGVHPGHPVDQECHIFVGSKAEWERIGDDLPKYDGHHPE